MGGNLRQRTRCAYLRDGISPCNKREPGSGCAALEGFNRGHAILGTSEHCIALHPSDVAIALVAFDAVVHTTEQSIPFDDFFLLPGETSSLRRALEQWFEKQRIRPRIFGEFDDSTLIKVFGQAGAGVFAAPSIIESSVRKQYGVAVVARLDRVRERFYAVSAERRLKHPGVIAITESARRELFV